MSLIAEFQRRNVTRVALLYLVTSWLVLQVVDTLVPALALPPWTIRLVALFLIIGFPLALIFSWVYELTPEGLKRERDIVRGESITGDTGRKLNVAIVAMLVVTIGVVVFDRLVPESSQNDSVAETMLASDSANDSLSDSSAPTQSIAVLPFEAIGADQDETILLSALAGDLRFMLASGSDLKVIGSLSSKIALERAMSATEIGNDFHVRYLLRGSLRKLDNAYRIQTELIDTVNGYNVHSQSFTSDDGNIGSIQKQIFDSILDETGAERRIVVGRSLDPQNLSDLTYTEYLNGTFLLDQGTADSYHSAIESFELVTSAAPQFAPGWARLARARLGAAAVATDNDDRFDHWRHGKIAGDRALALDSEFAEVWAVIAAGKLSVEHDFAGGRLAAERAVSTSPRDEYPWRIAGVLAAAYGDTADALRFSQLAAEADPLSTKAFQNVALMNSYLGNTEAAIVACDKVIQINPDTPIIRFILARSYADLGSTDQALATVADEPLEAYRLAATGYILAQSGKRAGAERSIGVLVKKFGDTMGLQIAENYAKLGEQDLAFQWLDTAHQNQDGGLAELRSMPAFKSMYGDPRWNVYLTKIGLQDTD